MLFFKKLASLSGLSSITVAEFSQP